MAPSLVQPQGHISPAEALQLAQQAPSILKRNPKAFSASPLSSLFTATETADLWTIYENLLLSCLRTGDDESAHQCLERLVLRFGDQNERVMALKGLVKEAEATNNNELQQVLKEYEDILEEDGTNIPIAKRRVALLRSMGKAPEAISSLVWLLEFNPTDAEAWGELADLYLSQGLYSQAIYALEEVLVLIPNAWNMHARLGEVSLMAANETSDGFPQKYLANSVKRFCRSIELCEDYLRGYYGLKKVTDKLLAESGKLKKHSEGDEFSLPDQGTIEKLNQAATNKLAEIVRRYGAQEPLWQGYNADEIAAARELLDKLSSEVVR
ncbi:kinetoplast-associated KAP [Fusarium albosuccineum]|uniref:ER membrane protein complex subunit 2 n=1 Tax=Fusarium albosuccineum TaxID=1237068 RepID=A0A8H4L306_9HYPO|nr:kinetoplast-associated KAP [Fusarium albosuccineum]